MATAEFSRFAGILSAVLSQRHPSEFEILSKRTQITDVGNLIPGSSAFFKTSLNIWKFMVRVLLKPDLENFEHYFTNM